MKNVSTKFLGFMLLLLGVSACTATTDEPEDRQTPLDTARFVVDEELASDGTSYAGLEPEREVETILSSVFCDSQVHYPHKSMHFPGTVNVLATVTCTSSIPQIRMTVMLERDGVQVASSTVSNSGSAVLSGHAATPCVNGTYQGRASATVTFPPGIIPIIRTRNKTSKQIPIIC